MDVLTYADPALNWWANALRFSIMLLGAVLIGMLYRWQRRERRRQYMAIGAGVTLLVAESIIDHFQRLGDPLSYRVPFDLLAFGLLISGLMAISNTIPSRQADRRKT